MFYGSIHPKILEMAFDKLAVLRYLSLWNNRSNMLFIPSTPHLNAGETVKASGENKVLRNANRQRPPALLRRVCHVEDTRE
jgi:hypothetical protein